MMYHTCKNLLRFTIRACERRLSVTDSTLTGKMVKRLLNGLATGLFLIVFLYFGSTNMLRQYLITSDYLSGLQKARVEEFQAYVDRHALAATDSVALRTWATERNIRKFTVSRENWLLFDLSQASDIYPGGRETGRYAWQFYHTVTFADGDGYIYLDEGETDTYYYLLSAISTLSGFAACLYVFISGMQKDVATIRRLKEEVDVISHGNLSGTVTIQGTDELARLAYGLERMRRSLLEKEQTEAELRAAQEKLVLGMSHDLRTPLTGLMTYMEILRKLEQNNGPGEEYVRKAYDKVLQIRHLSDQMFEYFLISSHKQITPEPPEEIRSAFGDYLSEMCALLECEGFVIHTEDLVWNSVFVQVHTGYMGRIVDNIFSNLEKYADRARRIRIEILYETDRTGIAIQNHRLSGRVHERGTGIGVRNITRMMEQMGGTVQVEQTEDTYQITLYFPCVARDSDTTSENGR